MIRELVRWPPIEVGRDAPFLSLTADDGSWVRLPDFRGKHAVVLLFFRSLDDQQTIRWLTAFDRRREQLAEHRALVFGVSMHRTERLRAYRAEIGVEFPLLYDPLALAARAFRCSGRVRPDIKPSLVVVGKDGRIATSRRGMGEPSDVLELLATPTAAPIPKAHAAPAGPERVREIDSRQALALLADSDKNYVLVDVRTLGEFASGHSPFARHIPVDEIPHRYHELGQTTRLLFVCQGGGRSAQAAEFLTSIGGSEIYNVLGGMSAWEGERVQPR
jgi:rhodanese-related sulfurtransferase/peroxiredoxin